MTHFQKVHEETISFVKSDNLFHMPFIPNVNLLKNVNWIKICIWRILLY